MKKLVSLAAAVAFSASALIGVGAAQNELFWDTGTSYDPLDYVGEGEVIPRDHTDMPTRNRVVIYMDPSGEVNQYNGGKPFTIDFVGLYGTSRMRGGAVNTEFPQWPGSGGLKLLEYYTGMVVYEDEKSTNQAVTVPPESVVLPFSGSMLQGEDLEIRTANVFNIPIPDQIGPIVAVTIGTGGERDLKIDKMLVDGRIFSFQNADGPKYFRMSTHPYLVGYNGEASDLARPADVGLTLTNLIAEYGATGQVFVPTRRMSSAQSAKYPGRVLYRGPTMASETKTVRVRIQLGDVTLRRGKEAKVPTVSVQLVSTNGDRSAKVTAAGPSVFRQRFAEISVPGDFAIEKVNVSLPQNESRAVVEQVGLTVQEGIEAETVYQDRVELTSARRSADIKRFGEGSNFRIADLERTDARDRLRQQSTGEMIGSLAKTPDETAALNRVLTARQLVLSRYTFEEWFSAVNAGTLEATLNGHDLMTDLDNLFSNRQDDPVSAAWKGGLRARLEKLINDRALSMSLLERIERFSNLHYQILESELTNAERYLDLANDKNVSVKLPGSPGGSFTTGTLASALSLMEFVPVPAASQAFASVNKIVGVVRNAETVAAVGKKASGPIEVTGTTSGASEENALKVAIGVLGERAQEEHTAVTAELETLRTLVIRDRGLLDEMARAQHALSTADLTDTRISSDSGIRSVLSEASTDQIDYTLKDYGRFAEQSRRLNREQLLRQLLPVRGIVYAKRVGGSATSLSVMTNLDAFQPLPSNSGKPRPGSVKGDVLARSYTRVVFYQDFLGRGLVSQPRGTYLTAWEHDWRFAIGSPEDGEPAVASEQSFDGRSTWDYITEALSGRDVFFLMATDAPDRFFMKPRTGFSDCTDGADSYSDNFEGWVCLEDDDHPLTVVAVPTFLDPQLASKVRTVPIGGNSLCDMENAGSSKYCGKASATIDPKTGKFSLEMTLLKDAPTPVPGGWEVFYDQ